MKSRQMKTRLSMLFAALLLVGGGTVYAQKNEKSNAKAVAGTGTNTFTVTAVGKKESAPSIAMDDVQLYFGKERKQIGEWKRDDHLALAILIDDSIDSGAAGQWDYLKSFILAQPPTTLIAVGYISNNTVQIAQDFTPEHELAAKALRIPLGLSMIGSSPYLATIDMMKRWPDAGGRRSILMISSGIDYFRGLGFGPFSPDLDPLIQRAERQNTNIWTIYYPTSGHRGRGFYPAMMGQSNMEKMADDTGGESYYLGSSAPVSIKPYLDEITQHLSNQYLLTFAGSGGTKGRYQPVKLKTELKDVEFFAPSAVYLPPSK